MKQRLENSLYRPIQESKENLRVYVVSDLESLSSVALYYGTKGSPLGSLGSFGIVKTSLMENNTPVLKIRPLPALGADLHIHQHGGFISGAKIKPYGDDKGIKLTNYEASISDLYADLLKKKILIFPDKK